jgi:hypothetical protein
VRIHSFHILHDHLVAMAIISAFHSTQALSLSKMAEKILIEAEGNVVLPKHVTELEEANA